MSNTFGAEIERLRQRVFPLARFLHWLTSALETPKFHKRPKGHHFLFTKPGLTHFCLLRGVRMVSALNASIELARCGFSQEIAVVLRTMIEYSTQIDFMVTSYSNGQLSPTAAQFLKAYFEDDERGSDDPNRPKAKLNQKHVHDVIGSALDQFLAVHGSTTSGNRQPTSELLSNVYINFSNYVHGKYPESMDLYGGTPGGFHMNGKRGTPKDNENIEIIDTMITSASNCFKGMVQGLELKSIVSADPMLSEWFNTW
jgi:hypothetical protein